MDVDCSLALQVPLEFKLRTLVLIASGRLQVNEFALGKTPMTTLKQLYLRSGAALMPENISVLQDTYGQELRLLYCAKDKQACCTAQMPPEFQPGKLQECFCNACPECLARAGVPILCEGAWTHHGFDKHLRPHHSWVPKLKRSPKIMCTSFVSIRVPEDPDSS